VSENSQTDGHPAAKIGYTYLGLAWNLRRKCGKSSKRLHHFSWRI